MTKLFFACDVSSLGLGLALIDKVAPYVDAVKIGLEAMTAEDSENKTLASAFRCHTIVGHARDVMWDMKLHDIGNTTGGAVRNIVQKGSRYFTLHASASDAALAAAAEAAGEKSMPLAVTVLTDLDEPQSVSRFGRKPKEAVWRFAALAYGAGIRGFVCSVHEARFLRDKFAESITIVTPGIRPEWSVGKDEQKRVTTPTIAKQAGANAIVVGRPISKPPLMHTEASAARAIVEELAAA